MSAPGSKGGGFAGRLGVAVVVWSILGGVLFAGYRFVVAPMLASQTETERLAAEYEQLLDEATERGVAASPAPDDATSDDLRDLIERLQISLTASSGAPGTTSIGFSLDAFSGYATFRSPEMAERLGDSGLSLRLVDDGADYATRLERVRSGETPLAVFSIDSLIAASASAGELPATIVMVIDETVGADAVVAYESGVPQIDALAGPRAGIVATPASPSETLGRVMLSSFQLGGLRDDPFIPAGGAEAVLDRFRSADRAAPMAFVMWEPYVSEALREPGAHVLIDSGDFRGFIVDVLVAQREYLLAHEERVDAVVRAYFQANHAIERSGRAQLVRRDARAAGSRLSEEQAGAIVEGVWWKNTTENYAHFGLQPVEGVEPLPRMISSITRVLRSTGAIAEDPTGGQPERLFYDRIVRRALESGFHPGVTGAGAAETARASSDLRELTEAEWDGLVPVGTLQVERLVFPRGTARLTMVSESSLERLAETLQSFHRYYVVVRGNAAGIGDLDANRKLAADRARVAAEYLKNRGVGDARIRTDTRVLSGSPGEGQSVTFLVGQAPY